MTVTNPADDSIVTSDVQVAGAADVDAAVAAARAAYKGPWKKFSGAQRAACMNKLADLIEANIEKLAKLETVAMGQPVGVGKVFIGLCPAGWRCESYSSSVGKTANYSPFSDYAGYADKLGGEMFPEDGDGVYKLIRYEP